MNLGSTFSDAVVGLVGLLLVIGLVKAWLDYWRTLDPARRFWVWALVIIAAITFALVQQQRDAAAGNHQPPSQLSLWAAILALIWPLFVVWSWVPIERLDERWPLNNEVGRPLMNAIVLTGLPALYAATVRLSAWGLLMPICLLLTGFATLTGRFLVREAIAASVTTLVATLSIWALVYVSAAAAVR